MPWLAGTLASFFPPGQGNSLIYQLAGLLRPGVTLVIDPLVSLVDDQERRLVQDGVDRVVGLTSSKISTGELRDRAYQAIADGDALIVFLTPERLQTVAFREALGHAAERRTVNLAVIDEAHCVSEWGHDFRTAYLRVGRNLRQLTRGHLDDVAPPLLALTGTAKPRGLRDVLVELQAPDGEMIVLRPSSFDRTNLSYEVLMGSRARLETKDFGRRSPSASPRRSNAVWYALVNSTDPGLAPVSSSYPTSITSSA